MSTTGSCSANSGGVIRAKIAEGGVNTGREAGNSTSDHLRLSRLAVTMWLLGTTDLTLHFFMDDVPAYAILSHTWGREEVSFQDIQSLRSVAFQDIQNLRMGRLGPPSFAGQDLLDIKIRAGYMKIERCCSQAAADGYQYAWIDTCCIDKTNSSELSEAINSMFKWYRNANECYAYLEDVASRDGVEAFGKSRWFKRGWTLQELIAPSTVLFFDRDWVDIGTKASFSRDIQKYTGIPSDILNDYRGTIEKYSVAQVSLFRSYIIVHSQQMAVNQKSSKKQAMQFFCSDFPLNWLLNISCAFLTYFEVSSMLTRRKIMSWIAARSTTREEDKAYSLLGLFNVSMPMLYGEGEQAFIRLQLEIIRKTTDHTIFAWTDIFGTAGSGPLARTPTAFHDCENMVENFNQDVLPFEMTNLGLRIKLLASAVSEQEDTSQIYFARLNCIDRNKANRLVGIWLKEVDKPSNDIRTSQYIRTRGSVAVELLSANSMLPTEFYLTQIGFHRSFGSTPRSRLQGPLLGVHRICRVHYSSLCEYGFEIEAKLNWCKPWIVTPPDTADSMIVELRCSWKPGVLLFKSIGGPAKSPTRFALLLGLESDGIRSGIASELDMERSAESVIESLLGNCAALQTRDDWTKKKVRSNCFVNLRVKNAEVFGKTGLMLVYVSSMADTLLMCWKMLCWVIPVIAVT